MIVPKSSTRESLETATSQYQRDLQVDGEAQEYLDQRGISSVAADYFRLGVVRSLISGHEKFKGRISFPYITPSGVVALRFRTIGPPGERSKFLTVTGDSARPYNTRALVGAREVYICEGETDTIAAYQSGLSAVGFPGVNSWAKDSRVYARVFANRAVTVLADNDDQGEGVEFSEDIYRTLGGCRIKVLPDGYDVSRYVLEHGPKALREFINGD